MEKIAKQKIFEKYHTKCYNQSWPIHDTSSYW